MGCGTPPSRARPQRIQKAENLLFVLRGGSCSLKILRPMSVVNKQNLWFVFFLFLFPAVRYPRPVRLQYLYPKSGHNPGQAAARPGPSVLFRSHCGRICRSRNYPVPAQCSITLRTYLPFPKLSCSRAMENSCSIFSQAPSERFNPFPFAIRCAIPQSSSVL